MVILAEILAEYIIIFANMKYLKVERVEPKTLQFADGTTLFTALGEKSLGKTLYVMKDFHTISGLGINVEKTEN